MREIKFRGKRLDDGEWEYGSLLEQKDIDACGSNYFIVEMTRSTDFDCKWKERVDPETVGQFIGIKDKYGKEIYEGDIVEDEYPGYKYVIKYTDERVGSCGCCYGEFEGIGFVGEEINGEEYCGDKIRCRLNSEIEIIGNIWDNSEMLKESD